MVFAKCPKCEKLYYAICLNCNKFDSYESIIKNNEGEPTALCSCGMKTEKIQSSCGATIFGKFFYEDKEKELEILQNKDQILEKSAQDSQKEKNFVKIRIIGLTLLLGFGAGFMISAMAHLLFNYDIEMRKCLWGGITIGGIFGLLLIKKI